MNFHFQDFKIYLCFFFLLSTKVWDPDRWLIFRITLLPVVPSGRDAPDAVFSSIIHPHNLNSGVLKERCRGKDIGGRHRGSSTDSRLAVEELHAVRLV